MPGDRGVTQRRGEEGLGLRLEAALSLLGHLSPGLKKRLQRRVTGLFLMRQPPAHGYYSRITGTCTLDLDALGRESPAEVAGTMVRCATEGRLWPRSSGWAPRSEP